MFISYWIISTCEIKTIYYRNVETFSSTVIWWVISQYAAKHFITQYSLTMKLQVSVHLQIKTILKADVNTSAENKIMYIAVLKRVSSID